MSAAIWTLTYRIRTADRERYLEWFHDIHIPEKLARPGYTWAAHYEEINAAGDPAYVAFFGGSASRVFYDPSRAQLKPQQNPQTREMMGLRVNGTNAIFVEEWQEQRAETTAPDTAAAISLDCVSVAGHDEAFGVFVVQTLAPTLLQSDGARAVHKWLNSAGKPRHAVLTTYRSVAVAEANSPAWGSDNG
ncbi:MAG: hypothetical protein HOI95_07550, partial [Chromatiales bacterium]|nr:hypothetical protein [Chromatiales bacterium]